MKSHNRTDFDYVLEIEKLRLSLNKALPKRSELIGKSDLFVDLAPQKKVNVWQNHNFGLLTDIIDLYLAVGKKKIEYNISDYDDTFSFNNYTPADVEIIWIDVNRLTQSLSMDDVCNWLGTRIKCLRHISNAPILVCAMAQVKIDNQNLQKINTTSDVYVVNLSEISNGSEQDIINERISDLTGSSLNPNLYGAIACELSIKWLCGMLFPEMKAIAVDLDNTLYSGILGEDGINGVSLTNGHKQLQKYLKKMSKNGVFLALISKNELEDVKNLFATRDDFPLAWEDFALTKVSWAPKSQSISAIIAELNISADATLFLDDNPGEILEVISHHTDIHVLLASDDADLSLKNLQNYPCVNRSRVSKTDELRVADFKANILRQQYSASANNLNEYIKALGVEISVRVDDCDTMKRVEELSRKTNQFNLNLSRLSLSDIEKIMQSQNMNVVTLEMKDKLSASGIIAILITELVGKTLVVQELCLSCRAMGRGLEDDLIMAAIKKVPFLAECSAIRFKHKPGPRNQPGLKWVDNFLRSSKKMRISSDTVDSKYVIDHLNNPNLTFS